jgi:sulfoxide reductase heme-binding subunit YedZ
MAVAKFHFNKWQIATHLASWVPLLVLVVKAITGNLTVNPIQAAEQYTGDTALGLLIFSISCSPIYMLYHWKTALKLRRPLGLYAFLYATLHFGIFLSLDYGFDLQLIWIELSQKPYIVVGFTAFLILTVLAITSFDQSKRILKKNWKRLHRVVYLAGGLVVLHFAWVSKGDFFKLTGDIGRPLLAGIALLLNLLLRLTVVKKWLSRYR